jgi:hypothetical protein
MEFWKCICQNGVTEEKNSVPGERFKMETAVSMTIEEVRLTAARDRKKHWKRWGPYLAERAWGTVREDYSPSGKPGNISRTTTRVRGPIAGRKTAWLAFAIAIKKSA